MTKPTRLIGVTRQNYFYYDCEEIGRERKPHGNREELTLKTLPTATEPSHEIRLVPVNYTTLAPHRHLELHFDGEWACLARYTENDEEVCITIFEY